MLKCLSGIHDEGGSCGLVCSSHGQIGPKSNVCEGMLQQIRV